MTDIPVPVLLRVVLAAMWIIIETLLWLNGVQWAFRLINEREEEVIMRWIEWFEQSIQERVWNLGRKIKGVVEAARDTLLAIFRFVISLIRNDSPPPFPPIV